MMFDRLSLNFDPLAPKAADSTLTTRRLSDLRGLFTDEQQSEHMIAHGDPVVYQVSAWQVADGDGDLICGFGTLFPGQVGDEYFFTKGHYHQWREAAEVYIGLSGDGYMLLEHEATGESSLLPLRPNQIIYVPGHTAHRTINVSDVPLTYVGIYSSRAGHDYSTLAEKNFRQVLINRNGIPVLLDRADYLASRTSEGTE